LSWSPEPDDLACGEVMKGMNEELSCFVSGLGFMDACKTNARARLFRANFKNALYQGTTLSRAEKEQ
jgi:hypothetical protein